MPIIRVEMFEGRSVEQKRAMVKEVTDAFVRTCGGNPASINVVITEMEKDMWATNGELFSDKVSS